MGYILGVWSKQEDDRLRFLVAQGRRNPHLLSEILGRHDHDIRKRMHDLGLSAPTQRPCIKCKEVFQSEGHHNRICTKCKTNNELFNHSLPHHPFYGGK